MDDLRYCSKCDRNLPADKFGKNARYCKECLAEYARKYYKKKPEKAKENAKKWQKENHDKDKESHQKWRENNPDKIKEYNEKWKETHPEEYAKSCQKYFGISVHELDKMRKDGKLSPLPITDEK